MVPGKFNLLLTGRCLLICFAAACGMCTACHVLFALPLGVVGISVIMTLPGHLLYHFFGSD